MARFFPSIFQKLILVIAIHKCIQNPISIAEARFIQFSLSISSSESSLGAELGIDIKTAIYDTMAHELPLWPVGNDSVAVNRTKELDRELELLARGVYEGKIDDQFTESTLSWAANVMGP